MALLTTLTVVGCTGGLIGLRGSGDMITESRDVSHFTQIVLEGSGIVRIEMTGTESLTIEAEDNLMPRLTSDVENGRLVLGTRGQINPTREIVYTVTVDALDGVAIDGSGHLEAEDITAGSFATDIAGSGTIEIAGLDIERLTAEISGSGNIDVSGTTDDIEVSIPGSGTFAGDSMEGVTGTISISGSGSAVVNVSESLDAEVSGSGVIEYIGSPAVQSTISGSGSIRPR